MTKKVIYLGIFVWLGITCSLTATVQASAPQQHSQAPGFYRLYVGNIEVVALNDGTFGMPVSKLLKDISATQLSQALTQAFLSDPVTASVNGFLINTGTKLVLIDTGIGANSGATVGHLSQNLAQAGYKPEQVDEIYITHMHGDHIGGLSVKGKPQFPNAIVKVAKSEADYWLNPTQRDAAPEEAKGSFTNAMETFAPYQALHHFATFADAGELVPGIQAIATHGHTPGHTIYEVSSQGQSLIIWGDLMHVAAVQFTDPSVTIGFDSDRPQALAQRLRIYALAAKQGSLVAGAHLPFPGIGHIRANGAAYEYVPVNYSTQF